MDPTRVTAEFLLSGDSTRQSTSILRQTQLRDGTLSSICPDLTGGLLSRGWRDCSVIKVLAVNPEAPSLIPSTQAKRKVGYKFLIPALERHTEEDPSDVTPSQPSLVSEP